MNFGGIAGAGIGGMNGLYNGLKETKAARLAGAVRRTQYVLLIHMHDQCLLRLQILTAGLIVKLTPEFAHLYVLFTTRCCAECGYATVCRLSVHPSETFRYHDPIGWNLEYFENNLTAN